MYLQSCTYDFNPFLWEAGQEKTELDKRSVQVFTSPDPLAESYYNVSPYAYCAYDPINYTDPTGLKLEGMAIIGRATTILGWSDSEYMNYLRGSFLMSNQLTQMGELPLVQLDGLPMFDLWYDGTLGSRKHFGSGGGTSGGGTSGGGTSGGGTSGGTSGGGMSNGNIGYSDLNLNSGSKNSYEGVLLAYNPPQSDARYSDDVNRGVYASFGGSFFFLFGGSFDIGYARDGKGKSSLFYTWGVGPGIELGVGINGGIIPAGTSLEEFANPEGNASFNLSAIYVSLSYDVISESLSGGLTYGKIAGGLSLRLGQTKLVDPLPNRAEEKASYYSTFGHIKR